MATKEQLKIDPLWDLRQFWWNLLCNLFGHKLGKPLTVALRNEKESGKITRIVVYCNRCSKGLSCVSPMTDVYISKKDSAS